MSITFEDLCAMKAEMMEFQHEQATENKTLNDRLVYFLDYNMDDSDVSDSVKIKVDKTRFADEIVHILEISGVDTAYPLDGNDKITKLPLTTPFDRLSLWYHDRLEYFCMGLRDTDYNYYTFVDISYDQMLLILTLGFNKGVITDITHPCWKF